MKNLILSVSLTTFSTVCLGQFKTTIQNYFSTNVGDSFHIYISVPPMFNQSHTYKVMYYCDADLKLGTQLRALIGDSTLTAQLRNVIFVGIGHIGNYHILRRRDFILPAISGSDTLGARKNYGQTERFYQFLKTELVPFVDSKFKTDQTSNSILGHSLSGLFAFYCLFKAEDLFKNYYALSPALWINKSSIYKFNKIQGGFAQKKYLYFASGSKEKNNKILKGTTKAEKFLDETHYDNLVYEYQIWPNESHNSEVRQALKKILEQEL